MYGLKELLSSVQNSLGLRFTNAKKYISDNLISLDTFKSTVITYMFVYSKYVNIVKTKYNIIYNKHPVVKSIVDYSNYFIKYFYSYLTYTKIEPLQSNWISTSVLSRRDKNRFVGDEYTLLESYEFMKNPHQLLDNKQICEINYNEICELVDSIVLNSSSYVEGMVKMKLGNNYFYRVFNTEHGTMNEFRLELLPIKPQFLSIEYTHPIMKKTISIELDKSVYFVNNQILSPTFIKLYLEYQSDLYHFDMDYVLRIIDSDINSFELRSNKHILLSENGYKVV
jgi:hypothetical protein